MNINQKVKAGYNIAAKNYTSEFRDQFKNEKHLAKLVDVLSPRSSILDVGCGAGKPIDSYLVSKGMKVTGIDISEAQIELAKSYVPEANYEVRDMSELQDGEYEVDAVVSFYAIFHTPRENHADLLKKFKSFLKSDGYLLITMGANDWVGKEDNFCGSEMYWSHYGADKNKELIEKAGFDIIFSEVDDAGGEKHLIILAKAK
ncbi:class I SAM-dependent methyltransferase [Candidatus Woesebacteria bacterium]|nr:MAG: class I SAM-dependent methyltransferase [Candidatus Woesebacteria bacterium]